MLINYAMYDSTLAYYVQNYIHHIPISVACLSCLKACTVAITSEFSIFLKRAVLITEVPFMLFSVYS